MTRARERQLAFGEAVLPPDGVFMATDELNCGKRVQYHLPLGWPVG
jgi:hypothetical protein